jgi:hypothetical protein
MTQTLRVEPGVNAKDAPSDNGRLQQAIDTVAASGGMVEVVAGTYHLNDAVHLRDGVRLVGETGAVFQKIPGVHSALTHVVGYGHCEFSVEAPELFSVGMGVLLSDDNAHGFYTTAATIIEQQGTRFFIDRPFAHDYNPQRGGCVTAVHSLIDGHGVRDAAVENIILDGNWPQETYELNGCRGGGVFLLGAHNIVLDGVEIRHFHGDAVSFQQCTDISVRNCFLHHNSGGGLHPGSGSVRYYLQNNRIEDNGACGIYYCLRTTHSLCAGNTISRNGADGISVGERDTNHVLQNNIIRENGDAGIQLREPVTQSSDHLWIEGNELRGNNRSGSFAEFFVGPGLNRIAFLDNRITAPSGAAIKIESNCSELFLAGNCIDGHMQNAAGIAGDTTAVSEVRPAEFSEVGPQAARAAHVRHLGAHVTLDCRK